MVGVVMLPALSPRRRRAERFADVLEGRSTSADPQLATLVQLADALRRVPAGPSPDFADQLRRRLVAVASLPVEQSAPVVRPRAVRVPVRRARLATGAIAAVTLLTAVSVGASSSLPGQALYGLKRAAEGAQLAVAGSDYQRGVRELQFADTRLREVAALAGRPDAVASGPAADLAPVAASTRLPGAQAPQAAVVAGDATGAIVDALGDMQTETGKGARYLARDYQRHHNAKALTTLHAFAVHQYAGLRALLPGLPAGAVPAATTSLGQVSSIDRIVYPVLRADRLCRTGCLPAVPTVPGTPGGSTPVPPGIGGLPSTGTPGDGSTSGGSTGGGSTAGSTPGAGQPGGGSASGGSSSAPADPLGGLLGGSGSGTGSGSGSGDGGSPLPSLPVPLPTTSLPVPLPTGSLPVPPLPTSSLPLPLPGGGSSSGQPAPQPTQSTQPAPGVTVCASPLILVGGVCVTVPVPPLLP